MYGIAKIPSLEARKLTQKGKSTRGNLLFQAQEREMYERSSLTTGIRENDHFFGGQKRNFQALKK